MSQTPSKEHSHSAERTHSLANRVARLIKTLHYPINSFEDLVRAVGKTVSIDELTVNLADLKMFVPAYFFPIASRENFAEKIAALSQSDSASFLRNQFRDISPARKTTFPKLTGTFSQPEENEA